MSNARRPRLSSRYLCNHGPQLSTVRADDKGVASHHVGQRSSPALALGPFTWVRNCTHRLLQMATVRLLDSMNAPDLRSHFCFCDPEPRFGVVSTARWSYVRCAAAIGADLSILANLRGYETTWA